MIEEADPNFPDFFFGFIQSPFLRYFIEKHIWQSDSTMHKMPHISSYSDKMREQFFRLAFLKQAVCLKADPPVKTIQSVFDRSFP